jgi:hypothetical protein
MTHKRTVISGIAALMLSACASQLPSGVNYEASFSDDENCEATKIVYEFISEPNDHWRTLLEESTRTANDILVSDNFAKECQITKMNKTLGKSVQEVCREMACSGTKHLKYDFFNDQGTSAIAREVGNGTVEFNIAKPNSGAGGPGNIAHEFTHTLGFKHFTNFAWLGKYSVPYEVGGIVQTMSEQ